MTGAGGDCGGGGDAVGGELGCLVCGLVCGCCEEGKAEEGEGGGEGGFDRHDGWLIGRTGGGLCGMGIASAMKEEIIIANGGIGLGEYD